MTNPFIDRLDQAPGPRGHDHEPTPAEIQRWEDDGGAVLSDPPPRPQRDRQRHEAELAAA